MTIALDTNLTSIILSLITLAGLIVTAIVTIKTTNRTNDAVIKQGIEQLKVSDTITKLEVNTNSMKDALVASTAQAYQAQGRAQGIASERANPQVSGNAVKEVLPLPPLPEPQPMPISTTTVEPVVPGEPKKAVSAMNVRIIPDQVIPVKETK